MARSSFSHSKTRSPRPAASRAMPVPFTPPPMTTMSYGLLFTGALPHFKPTFAPRHYEHRWQLSNTGSRCAFVKRPWIGQTFGLSPRP